MPVIPDIRTLRLPTPFPEGHVNAFLILGDAVTLIDTGLNTPESVNALKAELQSNGISLRDIDQIVITHMHNDHFAGMFDLQKEMDVPVYLHERARPLVTGGDPELDRQDRFMQEWMERCGAPELAKSRQRYIREWHIANANFLHDGDVLQAGGDEYQVLYVPGHSQTDIVLWHEPTGSTLAGDTLLEHISANAFIEAPAPGEAERPRTLLQMRQSMRRLKELPLHEIFPGHGVPYQRHVEVAEKRFAEQASRCEQILGTLQSGDKTVLQISSALFPRLKGNGVFLGLSEVTGHLDLLLEEGRVEEIQLDTHNLYRAHT